MSYRLLSWPYLLPLIALTAIYTVHALKLEKIRKTLPETDEMGLSRSEQMWLRDIGKETSYKRYTVILYSFSGLLMVVCLLQANRDGLVLALVFYLAAALIQCSNQALAVISKLNRYIAKFERKEEP